MVTGCRFSGRLRFARAVDWAWADWGESAGDVPSGRSIRWPWWQPAQSVTELTRALSRVAINSSGSNWPPTSGMSGLVLKSNCDGSAVVLLTLVGPYLFWHLCPHQLRRVRLPHRPLKLPMMRSGKDTQGAVSARTGSNTGHWYLTQELLCIASISHSVRHSA